MASDMDATAYAEALRTSLLTDFYKGDETKGQENEDQDEDYQFTEFAAVPGHVSLADLDKDLEQFQDHEVIKGILGHGRVMKEYSRDIDEKLRRVELDSIQDYIQESDNMVALHEQVSLP
jgi:hypothetical protein